MQLKALPIFSYSLLPTTHSLSRRWPHLHDVTFVQAPGT